MAGESRMSMRPFVSIIIPCLNEEHFIGACLDSIEANDYPKERLEVIVVDGMSGDDTRAIVEQYSARSSYIKRLDNPYKIVPTALNIGIKNARGELIMRMDAHSVYSPTYIFDCVRLMESSDVQNAGGRVIAIPNGDGFWAIPIVRVTSSGFGVGGGAFRTGTKPGFVDTVPFGIFRKSLFTKIGYFDERLVRNQDNEFNARIRKNGYRIIFDPEIKIYYKNQATLKGLVRQAFYTGMWNVYTLSLHPYTFQRRRFIPAIFLGYLFSLVCISLVWDGALIAAYSVPAAVYLALNLNFSFDRHYPFGINIRTFFTFICYHLSYGMGTYYGILCRVTGIWKRYISRPLKT